MAEPLGKHLPKSHSLLVTGSRFCPVLSSRPKECLRQRFSQGYRGNWHTISSGGLFKDWYRKAQIFTYNSKRRQSDSQSTKYYNMDLMVLLLMFFWCWSSAY